MADDTPALTVTQDGTTPPSASLDAITTLIHSFASMITAMEGRLTKRIDDNAAASKERWAKWEGRLEKLEGVVADHLTAAHDAEVAAEARARPVRTVLGVLVDHWRDILLAILAVLGLFGFTQSIVT